MGSLGIAQVKSCHIIESCCQWLERCGGVYKIFWLHFGLLWSMEIIVRIAVLFETYIALDALVILDEHLEVNRMDFVNILFDCPHKWYAIFNGFF